MKKVKSNAPRGGPSKTTHKHAKFSVHGNKSDDRMSLNLQRTEILDRNSKVNGKLLHCKMYTYIATFNARTLRKEKKRKELFHCFDSQSVTILGVMDHKIVHNESDDDIVYNQVNSSLFITCSAWWNDVNAAVGGVGIMINKRASNVLSEVIKWNERIIIATFEGNPKTTIIVHYSPVEGDDKAEQHYYQLSSAVKQVPKHSILIVLGDFNAHLDKKLAKYSYHETSNANGKHVNNFLQESNLFIANSYFQKETCEALDLYI